MPLLPYTQIRCFMNSVFFDDLEFKYFCLVNRLDKHIVERCSSALARMSGLWQQSRSSVEIESAKIVSDSLHRHKNLFPIFLAQFESVWISVNRWR